MDDLITLAIFCILDFCSKLKQYTKICKPINFFLTVYEFLKTLRFGDIKDFIFIFLTLHLTVYSKFETLQKFFCTKKYVKIYILR